MKYYLLLLLSTSLGCLAQEDSDVPETVWVEEKSQLSCTPNKIKPGDSVFVKLGGGHGKELAVNRHKDNMWLFLVVGSPPNEMVSLMSPEELKVEKELIISSKTTGFEWAYQGSDVPVFSEPGEYTIHVSEVLESEWGGYICSVEVSEH